MAKEYISKQSLLADLNETTPHSYGGYTSGYEHYGYRVDCICHKAWDSIGWCVTKEEAIKKWNGCAVEQ